MPDPTDRDLLRLAARGDAAASSDFYRRYVRVLLRELQAARRRGAAERRARDRLPMALIPIDDEDLERIERQADEAIDGTPGLDALERLPAAQREAVRPRVLDERSYGDVASQLRCSGAVVRQRVSRGLQALASELEDGR